MNSTLGRGVFIQRTKLANQQKMTYQTMILSVLQNSGHPMRIEELMDVLHLHKSKLVYVISGIKTAIEQGKIEQIVNPIEKRLYLGHTYRVSPSYNKTNF